MEHHVKVAKKVELFAKVIRADGTEGPDRCVAYWHRNPLMRLWARYVRGIKGVVRQPHNLPQDVGINAYNSSEG